MADVRDDIQQLHEGALIKFVTWQRRARYRDQLSNAAQRHKFLRRLPHFRDWSTDCIVTIEPRKQTAASITELLEAFGAPREAWIVSCVNTLDRQMLGLQEALDQVFGHAEGTVISCIPGHLAYYE